MKWKNLIEKYSVSNSRIEKAIKQLFDKGAGNVCDTQALIAIIDLLTSGDILRENDY